MSIAYLMFSHSKMLIIQKKYIHHQISYNQFLLQNAIKNCKNVDTQKCFLASFYFSNIYYAEKVYTLPDKFLTFFATKYH